MKLLRRLLAWVITGLVVLAILVTPAFIPAVQTWAVQSWLDRQPSVHGKIGTLWAGFGFVNVSDLRLEADGAVLTAPSLEAHLSVVTALRQRRFLVRSFEAKGWTLDLSKAASPPAAEAPEAPEASDAAPAAPSPPAPAAPPTSAPEAPAAPPILQKEIEAVQKVAGATAAALHAWRLPYDATFDGLDLEGDVILAKPAGSDPVKAHLILSGGGLTPGHEADLHVEAEIHDPELPVSPLSVQGTLTLTMDTPRTLSRIGLKTELASDEVTRQASAPLSIDAAVSRGSEGDTLAVTLGRETRTLLSLQMHLGADTQHTAGRWTLDLRDKDLTPLLPDQPLPTLTLTGSGDFSGQGAFTTFDASGQLKVSASHLEALEPRLDRLGAVALDGRFALSRDGDTVRVSRLQVSVAGIGRVAELTSLQPFSLNVKTRAVTASNPKADWADVSVPNLPVAWFSYLTDRIALSGGDVAGAFTLRPNEHGVAVRTKAALTATGLTVRASGRTIGQGLDLSLPLSADWSPTGWTLETKPLVVSRGGRSVVTLDGTASQPAAAGQPLAVTAHWSADLDALAASGPQPAPAWMVGRTASGDLTGKLTDSMALDSKFTVTARDPDGAVWANLHLDLDDAGDFDFDGPIKLGTGADATELKAKGSWTGTGLGGGLDLTVNGDFIDLDRLRTLAGPLAATAGIRLPSTGPSVAGARDEAPFWGAWSGRIDAAFGRFRAGGIELKGVGGVLTVRSQSIQLLGGHWMLPHNNLAKLDATVNFEPRSDTPYSVKGSADLNELDVAPLYPGTGEDKLPGVEGRFTITGDLRGSGGTFGDLLARTQAEFHMVSTGGVLRLFATSVAEAIPQVSTPVADTLNSVGSTVGTFLGTDRGKLENGKNPVTAQADSVINFTYETNEIGYDKIDILASRGIDGVVHLTHIELDAPEEHWRGTGTITPKGDAPLKDGALAADFTFAFKGHAADLLGKTSLLSGQKDAAGYSLLAQPVHVGGTALHLDLGAWHDLLVKAATEKPPKGK